jgi:hypothetical protein
MMFAFLLVSLVMHPVHETVAEVEWNSDQGRLEVALRIDAIDEQWLKRRHASQHRGDGAWQTAYLRQRFRISELPAEGEPDEAKYRWIGRDEDRGHVWWFFEIEPPGRKPPSWIEQRVLLEKEDNQVNRVLLLGRVPKQTLILTMQQPRASLKQAKEHESESPVRAGR